jgi:hypothetical protein
LAVNLDQFSKDLVYRTQAPSARVLQALETLRQLDTESERKSSETGSWGCGALLAAFACLWIAGFLMAKHGTAALLVFLLAIALGISGTLFANKHAHHDRLNLENRRYELVSQLMELLRVDIAPDEPLALALDLRPDTSPQKRRGERRTPTGWTVKSFLDPWLSLQGRLLDGTHFRVEMTERVEERTKPKRKRVNTRRYSDAIAKVQLRVKPERYSQLGKLGPRARDAVQLPEGTRLKSLAVEEDRLTLTVLIDSPWAAQGDKSTRVNASRVLAMMFLSLYQVLNFSRVLDKKAAHPPVG